MGIFERMGKVFSSNVNGIIDGAEDDAKLMELNLEEMAAQLKRGRQEVVSAVAAEKQLKKKSDDLQADVERWEKRAELAMKTGDEALAREALKQKKRARTDADAADRARVEARDTALAMKKDLEGMDQKLEELKMRKSTIVARAQKARGTSAEPGASDGGSAFAKFRALQDRVEGREAEGLAMAEVEEALGNSPRTRDLDAQFRELERGTTRTAESSDIDDELEALRKKVRI
jgi:phage shock protein A